MAAEVSLKSWFPRLRIYRDSMVRPSTNAWDTHCYLISHRPRPSKLKPGDICRVINKTHQLYGHYVRVIYADADSVETSYKDHSYFFKAGDLRWVRFTKIL